MTVLAIVLDEQVCFDTLFRVVRLSPTLFNVGDIVYLNGDPIHARLNFTDRKEKIQFLLDTFHSTELVALFPPGVFPAGTRFHGTEYYDSLPGSQGVFVSSSV